MGDDNRLSLKKESNRINIIETEHENIEINTGTHANDLLTDNRIRQDQRQAAGTRQQNANARQNYNNVLQRVQENLDPPLMEGYLPRPLDDRLRLILTDNRRASRSRFGRVKAAANALLAANVEAEKARCLGVFYKECMHYLKNRKNSSYEDRQETVLEITYQIHQLAAKGDLLQFEAIYDNYAALDAERIRRHGQLLKPSQYRHRFQEMFDAMHEKYRSTDYETVRENKRAEAEEKTDHDLDEVKSTLQAFEGMKALPFPSISFITGVKKEAYDPKEIENYNEALTGIGTLVTVTCAQVCNSISTYLSKRPKHQLLIAKYQNMLTDIRRQQTALDNAIADSYHSLGEKQTGKTLNDIVREKPQPEIDVFGVVKEGFKDKVYNVKDSQGRYELFQTGTTQSALSRIADLMGMGDMITRAVPATVKRGNTQISGSIIESPVGEKLSEKTDKYSPKGISAALSMNIFNIICGRSDGEYVVRTGQKDGVTTVDGIQMIAGSGAFDTSLGTEEIKKGKGAIAPFDPVMVMCLPEKTKKAIRSLSVPDIDLLLGNVLSDREISAFKERLGFVKDQLDQQDAQISALKKRNDPWYIRHAYAMEKSDEYRALYYKFYISKQVIAKNKERITWESQDERYRHKVPVMIDKVESRDYGPLESKNLEDANNIEDQLYKFLKERWQEFLPEKYLDIKNQPMALNDKKIPEKLKLSLEYMEYLELESGLSSRVKAYEDRQKTLAELADWKNESKGKVDNLEKAENSKYKEDVKGRIKDKFAAQGAGFVKNFNEKIQGTKLEFIGDNTEFLKKFMGKNFATTTAPERREFMVLMEKVFKSFLSIDMKKLSVKNADEFATMDPDKFNTIYRAYWQSLHIKNYISVYSFLLSENKKEGITVYDCALTEDDLDEIRLRYEVISNTTRQVDLMHRIHISHKDEDPRSIMSMSKEEILEKKKFWETKKNTSQKSEDQKLALSKERLFTSLLDYKYPQGKWKTSLQPDMEAYLNDARKNVYMLEDRTSLISDKISKAEEPLKDKNEEPGNTAAWMAYSNSKKIRAAARGNGGPDTSKAGELRSKAASDMKELLDRNASLMKPIDALGIRERGLKNRQQDLEKAKSKGEDTAAIEADIQFIKDRIEFLKKRGDDKTPITIKVADSVFGQPEDDALDKVARKDPLFPDGQLPKYDIKQGVNTCYFMAPIIGLIKSGNSSFITEELMHEVDETHVSVRLFDEDGIPVQLVLEKTAREGDARPLWILMLEKAVSVMTSRTNLGRSKRRTNEDGGAGQVHNIDWEKWDSMASKEGSVQWYDSANGNEELGAKMLFGKNAMGMTTRDPEAEVYGIGEDKTFVLYDYSPEAQTTIGKMSALLSDPSGKKIVVASTCSAMNQDYVNMADKWAPGSRRFRSHYNPTFDAVEYRANHYILPKHAYVFHKADDKSQMFLVTEPLTGREEWISYNVFARYFTDVKVMEA